VADSIEQALQECLELLRQGATLEQALARYPGQARELEPLLHTGLIAQGKLGISLPPEVRARVRSRVLAEWDRRHQRRGWGWPMPALRLRLAAAVASIVLVMALGGMGVGTAAAQAVPGDLLYPVKEFREGATLWFARSPEARVALYTSLVRERAEEVRALAAKEQASSQAISIALGRLDSHLLSLNALLEGKAEGRAVPPGPGLVEALQAAATEQWSAQGILEGALGQVPEEARPELRHAADALGQAQERVRAALEATGAVAPPSGR